MEKFQNVPLPSYLMQDELTNAQKISERLVYILWLPPKLEKFTKVKNKIVGV
jgi:hypothetical protein